jgi:hypothetical protein
LAPTLARLARSRRARRGGGLRALLGKAPDAREIGERLVRLAQRMFKRAVIDATPKRVTLALHPAAPPVRIVVTREGDLEITADTFALGPGYHAHVLALLAPMLEELEYVWDGEDPGEAAQAMAERVALRLAAGETRIAMPADRTFTLACAVQTAMGPRDAAWRDAVIREPLRAAEAFAWWETGPGREERSRALHAMWHEVPWREPLDDDERAVMEQVIVDLRAARKADPSLDLPYAEWAELLELLGEDSDKIRARAGDRIATIGYRRHPMDVELADGWTISLAGAFVGRWEDDHYWATDGERVVEFTSLTVDGAASSQELLDVAPEKHAVIARISDDVRRGRAEAYDEDDVHVVHGLMAVAPHVAILTCKGAVADEPWALATWRSLRNG